MTPKSENANKPRKTLSAKRRKRYRSSDTRKRRPTQTPNIGSKSTKLSSSAGRRSISIDLRKWMKRERQSMNGLLMRPIAGARRISRNENEQKRKKSAVMTSFRLRSSGRGTKWRPVCVPSNAKRKKKRKESVKLR